MKALKAFLVHSKSIMSRTMIWFQKSTESATMKTIKILIGIGYLLRKVDIFISNVSVSLIGLVIAIFLSLPRNQSFLAQVESADSIFLAIGGLIGTILALVLTLSIIPIQHAADNLTQSIIRLYREDRLSRYIFSILSIFCLVSFLMVFAKNAGLNKTILLILEFLIVAFSLDLLRFYHRHIINLLETDKGINKLRDRIKQKISWCQKKISFLARVKCIFLTKEQKKGLTRSKIESILYANSSHMVYTFRVLADELAEITLKAVARNEVYRAQLAIFALSDVACHYVTIRKDNLIIYNESNSFGVKGSDIDKLLTPIYEHYKDISRSAVAFRNETNSLHSIKALSQIAIHLTKLNTPAFGDYSAPLTYLPVGYIGTCIETAQRQGFEDVPLQGAEELLKIAKNVSNNVDICDIYLPVLNELNKIALTFLVSNKDAFLNICIEKIMTIAHHAVENKHFRADDVVEDIMKKLESLLPLALSYEKLYGAKLLGQPLTPAYDLSNPVSIGYLVAKAIGLNKIDKQKERVNPYSDFIDINKIIWRHFYNIGQKNEFGDSFILWHLLQTLKHIAKIFIQLLTEPITKETRFLDELSECFQWYCSFFWLAFNKKSSTNHHNAEEACDISAYIGLNFYKLGRLDVMKFCIDNISSITDSYCQISKEKKQYNPFDMVDLLMPLWYFRLIGEKHNGSDIIKHIDEKLTKFDVLKDGTRENEAFENRKRHLQNDLTEKLHFSQYDKALGVLKELLDSK